MRRTILRLLAAAVCVAALLAESDVALAQPAWTPPIGIPAPDFGITQTAPQDPSPWTGAVPGFYYVDQSAPGATDTNNPYGWPGHPRITIPSTVPAGSVVQLRGTYTRAHTSPNNLKLNGTSAGPVFIRGANSPAGPRAIASSTWEVIGSYFIIENMQFAFVGPSGLGLLGPLNRGVVRNSEIRGNLLGGGMGIGTWSTASNSNAVIYNCVIHDNGNPDAAFDQDIHGIQIGWGGRTSNVWIIDNEFYRNSGDGLQIASGTVSTQASVHHIYVGRNISHNNKQTGMWAKQAVDVIFSQNTIYAHRSGNSSYGQCTGFQYATEHIWFLFNHIFDCEFGIGVSSDSGQGSGTNSYYIGNIIHNIHPFSGNYNRNTGWSNAAFMFAGGVNRWLVNNTIYDVVAGINVPDGVGRVVAVNNIIANLSNAGGSHLFFESLQLSNASKIQYLILGETPRLRWGNNTEYTTIGSFQSDTGKGQNMTVASVQFVNPGTDDFHLVPGSPGTGAGIVDSVYSTFFNRYGLDIRKGADGVPRAAVGQASDLGAYQGTGDGATGSAPAAPTNVRIIGQQ